jgi:hypothetical protein
MFTRRLRHVPADGSVRKGGTAQPLLSPWRFPPALDLDAVSREDLEATAPPVSPHDLSALGQAIAHEASRPVHLEWRPLDV